MINKAPVNQKQESFKEFLLGDLLADMDGIEAKKMFGSYGLYLRGKMCGIINDETLYLKTDEETKQKFAEKECKPFSYNKGGETAYLKNYISIPTRLLDDADELKLWIQESRSTIR